MGIVVFEVDRTLDAKFTNDASHPHYVSRHIVLKQPAIEAELDKVKNHFGEPKYFTVDGYGDLGGADCYTGKFRQGGDYQYNAYGTPLHMVISTAIGVSEDMGICAAVESGSHHKFNITGKVVYIP